MKLKSALLGAAAAFVLAPAAHAERGTDGDVKILYYQAVSTLNAYLSSGTKDVKQARWCWSRWPALIRTATCSPVWLTASPPWKTAVSRLT